MEVHLSAEPVLAISQQVAEYLRQRILDGVIVPGERIFQEEVAQRFGTSRLPVREALRILAAEGLTELEPNKGARVPLLDPSQLSILYQMRERLEPLALSESVPKLDSSSLDQMRSIQVRIESSVDVMEFLELDREFHALSYSGCDSDQLMSTVTRFWNTTQYYRRLYMELSGPNRIWIVNAEHRLIIDAVDRGDSEDAERFLAAHIRRTRQELLTHPEIFDL